MKRKKSKNLIHDLKQIFYKVDDKNKRLFLLLIILLLTSSISEFVSLAAIVKYMDVLTNPDLILNNSSLGRLLNLFQIESSYDLIVLASVFLIATILISNCLRIFTIKFQSFLSGTLSTTISIQVYNNTIKQPFVFHVNRNTSELISSVMEDTRQLYLNIILPVILLISNSFLIIAILISITLTNWQLSLISFLVIGAVYILIYKYRKSLLLKNSQILIYSSQQQVKIVQESLGGIRDVLIDRNYKFFQDKYLEADVQYRSATASNFFIGSTPRYITETVGVILVVCLAFFFSRDGNYSKSIPLLSATVFASNRILPLLQQQFAAVTRIQGARGSLNKILWCLNLSVTRECDDNNKRLDLHELLYVDDLWFRYQENSRWILKGISFEIKANTTVALVGSSGSGKSTTADLILGLLHPQKGRILIDKQFLIDEKVVQWQNSIAHVPQSIFLIDGTIAENIAFGLTKDKIDFHRVIQAAKLSKIDEFIEQLPEQYNSKVGERGSRLSGGQRQRIGIARALYKQASVIVFDEATSSLDSTTEREVMESINNLSNKITIILIAHRLSTIKNCDQIIELSDGQVSNKGTYKDLLERSSSFRRMVQG